MIQDPLTFRIVVVILGLVTLACVAGGLIELAAPVWLSNLAFTCAGALAGLLPHTTQPQPSILRTAGPEAHTAPL